MDLAEGDPEEDPDIDSDSDSEEANLAREEWARTRRPPALRQSQRSMNNLGCCMALLERHDQAIMYHRCGVLHLAACGVVWCGVVWCGVVWCGVVFACCEGLLLCVGIFVFVLM
jgi:hypothetical protein